jgi:hypothetical protein
MVGKRKKPRPTAIAPFPEYPPEIGRGIYAAGAIVSPSHSPRELPDKRP